MLDLLLDRAQLAAAKLYYSRSVTMPHEDELVRLRRSDEFKLYLMDALVWIDRCDGRAALTDRREEIIRFGRLLSCVLYSLEQRQLSWNEYYNLLLEDLDA